MFYLLGEGLDGRKVPSSENEGKRAGSRKLSSSTNLRTGPRRHESSAHSAGETIFLPLGEVGREGYSDQRSDIAEGFVVENDRIRAKPEIETDLSRFCKMRNTIHGRKDQYLQKPINRDCQYND